MDHDDNNDDENDGDRNSIFNHADTTCMAEPHEPYWTHISISHGHNNGGADNNQSKHLYIAQSAATTGAVWKHTHTHAISS